MDEDLEFPDPQQVICDQIVAIMATYDRQMREDGYIGTPGGLEHMGDVWRLLGRWRGLLISACEHCGEYGGTPTTVFVSDEEHPQGWEEERCSLCAPRRNNED